MEKLFKNHVYTSSHKWSIWPQNHRLDQSSPATADLFNEPDFSLYIRATLIHKKYLWSWRAQYNYYRVHRLLHHYTHITATVNTDLGSTCYTFFLMVLTLLLTWFYRFRSSSWDVKTQHFSALLYCISISNVFSIDQSHKCGQFYRYVCSTMSSVYDLNNHCTGFATLTGVYHYGARVPSHCVYCGHRLSGCTPHIGYPLSTALHALSLTLATW